MNDKIVLLINRILLTLGMRPDLVQRFELDEPMIYLSVTKSCFTSVVQNVHIIFYG